MSVVGLIDFGICNLDSVIRALEYCGAKVYRISDGRQKIPLISHLVLPGVGSFKTAMTNLQNRHLIDYLDLKVVKNKIPLLGICLGMQLLANVSFEHGETTGLGLIPGRIIKLALSKSYRLPHMGWNEVKYVHDRTFDNIRQEENFYFVHSYYFKCEEKYQIAETIYEISFPSVVRNEHILGVQFHPEKSQNAGMQLLKNFLYQKV